VIHGLIDEVASLLDEIDALLVGEAKETGGRGKTRYITFHLCDSRYKLSGLCLFERRDRTSKVE
jgi:hypothetical protein